MKRCPQCRRDYFDDSLRFCLDDGTELLEGPARQTESTVILERSVNSGSEGKTEIIQARPSASVSAWRGKWRTVSATAAIIVVAVASVLLYRYFAHGSLGEPASTRSVGAEQARKLYWQMTDSEKAVFVQERSRHVQTLIGDEPADLDEKAVAAIREQIEDFVKDKDSLSQKPFEEGPRAIYGRATQFTPIVIRSFESHKVPAAIGIYQAVVESEYHDCPRPVEDPGGYPVGLFQFSRKTAALYAMKPADYCNVEKQCDAAARYMSDLISDFGSERSSWTLALAAFNQGPDNVRELLRQLRSKGLTERNYWSLFEHQKELDQPLSGEGARYVPRFFAAAIIGETPTAFDLSTPPLSTVR